MRKLLFFAVFGCFCINLYSQLDYKLSDMDIKGSVSFMTEKEFQVKGADYSLQTEIRRSAFAFNKNGCKIEEEYSTPEGEVAYQGVFKYSENGNIVEEKISNFEVGENFIKTYDIGKSAISVNIQEGSAQPTLLAKYIIDSKNNVTKRTDYNNSGGTFRVLDYLYDASGKITSETQQMPGSEKLTFKYLYNSKGQLEKKQEVNNTGAVTYTQSYTYDEKGSIATETSFYVDDPQKLLISYKYIYDDKGNWIEKQEYMDGNLFSVVKREIAYF